MWGTNHDMKATWSKESAFAYPDRRMVPLQNADQVRAAIANFDQTENVTDDERIAAFANIREAAKYFEIDMAETDWRQLAPRRQGAQK